MQIPSGEFWAGIGTIIVAGVGYAFNNTRKLGSFLTREEHERICGDRNTATEKKLDKIGQNQDEIRRLLEKQSDETRDYRDRISNSLHAMGLNVAVIQTKLGLHRDEV